MSKQGARLSFSVENLLGLRSEGQQDRSLQEHDGHVFSRSDTRDQLDNLPHKDDKCQRTRRRRILFTESQVDILKSVFAKQKYLSSDGRKKLAESLNLSPKQVKTWFQNYRYKCRRKSFDEGYAQDEDHEIASRLGTTLAAPTGMGIPHSDGSTVFFRNPYYSLELNASMNTCYDRYYSPMANFSYRIPYQHLPTCPRKYTNQ